MAGFHSSKEYDLLIILGQPLLQVALSRNLSAARLFLLFVYKKSKGFPAYQQLNITKLLFLIADHRPFNFLVIGPTTNFKSGQKSN